MATDFNTLALLHQWFPDVYPAPAAVAAAPDQPSLASPTAAQTVDGIVSSEPSGGGAFGGPEQSQGPAGAFSDPGAAASSGASPGGRSIGDRLGTLGDRMVANAPGVAANMAGNAALGALGVTGPAAMAAMGIGRGLYDIAMAPGSLSPSQIAETLASNMDPTKGLANFGNFAYDNTIGAITDTRLGLRGLLESLGIGNPAQDARQEAAKASIRDELNQAAADPYAGDGPEGQGGAAQGNSYGGESHESASYGAEGGHADSREGTDTDSAWRGGTIRAARGGRIAPPADPRLAMLMALLRAHQDQQMPARGAF